MGFLNLTTIFGGYPPKIIYGIMDNNGKFYDYERYKPSAEDIYICFLNGENTAMIQRGIPRISGTELKIPRYLYDRNEKTNNRTIFYKDGKEIFSIFRNIKFHE